MSSEEDRPRWASRVAIAIGVIVALSAVGLIALIAWPQEEAVAECEPQELSAAAAAGVDTPKLRSYQVCREGGGEHAYLYLVAPEVTEDPAVLVEACPRPLTEQHAVVTCYAFASDRAYSAAGVRDAGGMERACWSSYLERRRGQGGRGLNSNPDYEDEGCP